MDRNLRRPFLPRWIGPAVLGVACFVVAWLAIAVATYHVAIWLHPARTSDGLHRVMPIGQAALGALVATVVTGLLLVVILVGRRQRRGPPDAP